MNHYDVQAPETSTPAMTEFICASISSVSMFAAAETNSATEIDAAKDGTVNAHIKYADTDAHGFAQVCVTENELQVKLVTIQTINSDTAAPGITRTASFTVPTMAIAGKVEISSPVVEGEVPFPL